MTAQACPAEEKELEMPVLVRRIVAGLAIAAALTLVTPAITEAAPSHPPATAASPSLWSATWEWLVSVVGGGGPKKGGTGSPPTLDAGGTIDPDGFK
jgi:hypothetical protein